MSDELPPPGSGGQEDLWNRILRTSLAIPGAKIDRKAFLRKELSKHISPEMLECAIETTPAKAGVPKDIIRRIATTSIRWHRSGVSSVSFIAGIPGGWWTAGTVPGDLAQFFWHVLIILQKLAYLYGWPDIVGDEEHLDDETLLILTVFIGVMLGAEAAAKLLRELARRVAVEVFKRLPREALTKYGLYRLAREIAKWITIKLTKETFARYLSKMIPVISGFISGTITWISFSIMSKRLRKHLESLPLAG